MMLPNTEIARALAEMEPGEWMRTNDISRWGTLGQLSAILVTALERGLVEREDRNPWGSRHLWRYRLTDAGEEFLRGFGYHEEQQ